MFIDFCQQKVKNSLYFEGSYIEYVDLEADKRCHTFKTLLKKLLSASYCAVEQLRIFLKNSYNRRFHSKGMLHKDKATFSRCTMDMTTQITIFTLIQ